MLKKTIALLMLLTVLLVLFVSCDSQEPTEMKTETPTGTPSETASEYGSDTCTEPSERMTELLTEEPPVEGTVEPTDEPTEACTHEWEAVVMERCKICGEIHEQSEDSEYVKYHFGGIFTVARFDDAENVRECTDRAFLKLLNEKQWQRYDNIVYYLSGYGYEFNFDGNLRLYYSSFHGKFSNFLDGTYVKITEEERKIVNQMLTALFPSSLAEKQIDKILLSYCGNKNNIHTIEDAQEIELLMGYICKMDARQIGDSTEGHSGCAFGIDLYAKEKKIASLSLWDNQRYSAEHLNHESGYEYFYYGDLSEIYNYLNEQYPSEFWYGD